jgi:hypothetical protein
MLVTSTSVRLERPVRPRTNVLGLPEKQSEDYAIPGYGSKLHVTEFLGMEDRNSEVKPTPQPEEHPTSYCRLTRRYCGTETLFIAGYSCPLYILRGRASWRVNISPTVIVLQLDSKDIMLPLGQW